ncbi:transposase [Legionella pneumophila]
MFLLQQLFNKTDPQIEYDVKDNAAYQLFCGVGIVEQ